MAVDEPDWKACALCGQELKGGQLRYVFPDFVVNELDRCYAFSAHEFHEACLRMSQDGSEAMRRAEEWKLKTAPENRKCAVCSEVVAGAGDYLLISHLSGIEDDQIREFNYTHLHGSCLAAWQQRSRFIELAKALLVSGRWKGGYLPWLIGQFERAAG